MLIFYFSVTKKKTSENNSDKTEFKAIKAKSDISSSLPHIACVLSDRHVIRHMPLSLL
jgi:hypothetical protein